MMVTASPMPTAVACGCYRATATSAADISARCSALARLGRQFVLDGEIAAPAPSAGDEARL
jgi:hypothetical protein